MRTKLTALAMVLAVASSMLLAGADPGPVALRFELEDINPASGTHGSRLSLDELYEERGVVLNFISSWCGYCWKELPDLQALHESGEARVIGIAADEYSGKPDLLVKLLGKNRVTLPVLYVPPERIDWMERFYNHPILPATYVIDRKGRVTRRLEGAVQKDQLYREIEAGLDESTP